MNVVKGIGNHNNLRGLVPIYLFLKRNLEPRDLIAYQILGGMFAELIVHGCHVELKYSIDWKEKKMQDLGWNNHMLIILIFSICSMFSSIFFLKMIFKMSFYFLKNVF